MKVSELLKFILTAARTKNYSGAEIEGVVKSAVSYALNRQLSLDDLTKPVDEENIKVTMDDFLNAVQEIIPAFGASTDDLERCRLFYELSFVIMFFEINVIYYVLCRLNGMVDCGGRHKHIYERAMLLVEQVKVSKGSPLVTCLLEGPSGRYALSSFSFKRNFCYTQVHVGGVDKPTLNLL